LKEGHPALRLLQQVRDEAHRFSITNQRKRRTKAALETSALTDIHGIGAKTKAMLLIKFGSLEKIRDASVEDLVAAGVTHNRAEALQKGLRTGTPVPDGGAEE